MLAIGVIGGHVLSVTSANQIPSAGEKYSTFTVRGHITSPSRWEIRLACTTPGKASGSVVLITTVANIHVQATRRMLTGFMMRTDGIGVVVKYSQSMRMARNLVTTFPTKMQSCSVLGTNGCQRGVGRQTRGLVPVMHHPALASTISAVERHSKYTCFNSV